jgi:DNA-binding FadR family transcriptional regulator
MRGLKSIRKTTLAEGVAREILGHIRKGAFKSGDRLPSEKDLMAQMGVGRSSVREAIQRLSHLDIVRSQPGRGTFVCEIPRGVTMLSEDLLSLLTKDALGELIEVRICLETRTAFLAAQNATAKDVEALEETLKLEREDERLQFECNAMFHLGVAKASHNRFLVKLLKEVVQALRRESEEIFYRSEKDNLRWLEYHRQVYQAIKEGDPQSAQQWMLSHFECVQEVLAMEDSEPSNTEKH